MPENKISTTGFTVFPAIDLRQGKVVRLVQGDPGRQTDYSEDPRTWAERWKAAGASWLHVINLDGAFGEDTRLNLRALEEILATGLKVEMGGGIRDDVSIDRVLGMGVERVFLGTAAIQNPDLLEWAVRAYGAQSIAGDIGARDGKVVIRGWQESTPLTVLEVGRCFRKRGVETCVLTDVSRDGTGGGANITSAVELQTKTQLKVVVSGGVSSLEEVRNARRSGLAGIIIGKALYEEKLRLEECLKI